MPITLDLTNTISTISPKGTVLGNLVATPDMIAGVLTRYFDITITKLKGSFAGAGAKITVSDALTESPCVFDVSYTYNTSDTTTYSAVGTAKQGKISVILGLENNDFISGTAANEYIGGNDGDDKIFGGLGNDSLYGNIGDDELTGQGGDDSIRGGKGNDYIWGESGNDSIFGDIGSDVISGGVGNDVIRGGRDSDTLLGQDGADELWGDKGDDNLTGGAGNDTFSFLWHDTGSGNDVIEDFDPKKDIISLRDGGMSYRSCDYASIAWRLTDTVKGVIVDLDDGNSVLLKGISRSQLATVDHYFFWSS
jgi:Ca2+-binding RTX toxin-like protein